MTVISAVETSVEAAANAALAVVELSFLNGSDEMDSMDEVDSAGS